MKAMLSMTKLDLAILQAAVADREPQRPESPNA
jgi:hypothetical protein